MDAVGCIFLVLFPAFDKNCNFAFFSFFSPLLIKTVILLVCICRMDGSVTCVVVNQGGDLVRNLAVLSLLKIAFFSLISLQVTSFTPLPFDRGEF